MRRLGEVVRAVGGMALARSTDESHPEIGTEVIDDQLDRIGEVVDVIGPTDRPFVVIAPDDRKPASLLNDRVYVR